MPRCSHCSIKSGQERVCAWCVSLSRGTLEMEGSRNSVLRLREVPDLEIYGTDQLSGCVGRIRYIDIPHSGRRSG